MLNKAEWLTDKYIMLMLLVFPLWTGFEGYASLTVSKYLFFVIATGAWLLGLSIGLVLDRRALAKPRPCQYCCFLFMAALCLSAAFSPYGKETLIGAGRYDGLITLLLYGCIFLGISAFGRMRRLYLYLLAASATLCCVVALLQLYDVNALWLFPSGLSYYDSGVKYSGAFLGTIGNVDVLAAFFALSIPVFAAAPIVSGKRRDLWLLLPAALCVYVLYRSGVASGMLALILAAPVCGPYLAFIMGKKRLCRALIFTGAGLAAVGLAAVYFWPGSSGTVWELSQMLRGNVQDSFGSSRILIWRDCLSLVRERPLLGGGPDTLTLRTALGFSRYVPETGRTLSNHVDNAHNEFLGYLVNTGLLGLAGYLSVLGASLTSALRLRKNPLISAMACGAVCYLIQSFFGLGLCVIVPLPWIFLGLICSNSEEKE